MDHAADAHRTDLMTITRHVLNEQSRNPESRGDFTILLSHIVLGCKFVASAVNKAGLAQLIGLAGETNVQASACISQFLFRSEIDRDVTMPYCLGCSTYVRATGRRAEEAGCPVQRGVRQGPRQQRSHRTKSFLSICDCPFEFRVFSVSDDSAPVYIRMQCVLVSEEDEEATFVDPKLRGK